MQERTVCTRRLRGDRAGRKVQQYIGESWPQGSQQFLPLFQNQRQLLCRHLNTRRPVIEPNPEVP